MVRPEILTKESMLADYAPEFVVDVWPGVKSVHGTHSFQSSAVHRLNSTLESVLSIKIRISYSQVSMDLWDGFTIPDFSPGVNSQITRKLERIFYFPSEKTCAIMYVLGCRAGSSFCVCPAVDFCDLLDYDNVKWRDPHETIAAPADFFLV